MAADLADILNCCHFVSEWGNNKHTHSRILLALLAADWKENRYFKSVLFFALLGKLELFEYLSRNSDLS